MGYQLKSKPVTTKGQRIGHVRAIPKEAQETREVPFTISTDQVDRYNTILKADRWDLSNYEKNPIVGYQHNVYGDLFKAPNPDDVIGMSSITPEDHALKGTAKFEPPDINPLAEKIFKKVLFGSLRSASVGFSEIGKGEEDDKTDTYTYGGQELLEWSVVNIPANPGAVVRQLENAQCDSINYLMGVIGRGYSFEDIKEMRVKHIIKLINGRFINGEEEERVKAALRKQKGMELFIQIKTAVL